VTPRINPEYGVWSPPGKIKSSDTVGTICHDGKLPNSLSNGVTPQSDGYHFGINIIVGNDATVSAPSYRSHRMAVANLRLSGLPKLGVDIALVRQGHGISNLWMMIVAHQVDMHEQRIDNLLRRRTRSADHFTGRKPQLRSPTHYLLASGSQVLAGSGERFGAEHLVIDHPLDSASGKHIA
jgi:hypothetical protein